MSQELVIERTPFGARAALLADGRLIEAVHADDDPGRVDDRIFLGRVRALDPALDAAFVDCGLAQDAWLTARHARPLVGAAPGVPISRRLHEGQAVLVQGLREATGGKGPRVTGDIALPGLFLALRPRRRQIELSARLLRSPERDAERARATRLFPEGGVLLRSAARAANDDELMAEAACLRELWREIEARAATARPPACLYDAGDPVTRVLMTLLGPGIERIAAGDPVALARARAWLDRHQPALCGRLEHLPDAFRATGAEEQLEQAQSPVVPLDGGGTLVIEPTAALTAIDVNGGGCGALEVNLEAAREIARQIRLRRIGGSIVVDFVDMTTRKDRARVEAALREALRDDPMPVQVWPIGGPGLALLSRKRAGPSLAEQQGRTCPACGGTGLVPALRSRAEALARALDRITARVRVRLAPDLGHYLRGEGARVRERLPQIAAFQVDDALPPGDYRIDPETKS